MVVTGWHNGIPDNKTGAGYGIRIAPEDRDQYFERNWTGVTLQFDDGDSVTVDLSSSFWADYPELRSPRIGKWMLRKDLAPWTKGRPPHPTLEPLGNRTLRLSWP
jgi:hypothetical protein